jgi:demethylmenaquinone methyltransferase/2-methoxy-6-polyprenyl-1,4-benzoquinol methylase
MLERNRRAVGSGLVTYIEADLFTWSPRSTYDFVFFSSWLSHVPFTQFDSFWDMVRRCLRPGGRVAFVDEDDRARGNDDLRIVDGTPVAARTLRDGRRYDIVKVFWQPHELEARLRDISWDISVAPVGETYLVGDGHDARATSAQQGAPNAA